MKIDGIEKYIIETTPARTRTRYCALKARAESSDFGLLDEDVVVIDTETTGVSFNHDELTQIAAARMVRGRIVDWFVTFVNPGKPIPEEIVHLTDIHDDDVHDAPNPDEALSKLVEFVGDSDLVAHNALFDKTFCTRHPSGASLASNIWIDSLDLARIALPRLKSHRLLDLVRAFDTPVSTHRADADVEALCAVYRILLAAVESMPAALVSCIAHMASSDEWSTVKVFQYFSKDDAPSFDLRRLRQNQVGKVQLHPRVDADDLAADPERGLKFPLKDEIDGAFSPNGLVGNMYDQFEARPEQVIMAEAVNEAFSTSTNLVVEAGTGVGKSMAYLVPAALLAKGNDITVGIATKTNALLDQLVNRELPLLASSLGDLTYASLKGFSHYPCLRLAERIQQAGPGTKDLGDREASRAPALAGLLSFIEQTDYDDLDGLKIDYRALPRYEITTTSHDCLRRKCPFFGNKCFVHGARLRAESADIVVTNQTLLFCDVAAEGGLLPPIRYWVVDEAHGAENEARRAFSRVLDVDEIRRLASRVSSPEPSRNVFLRVERQLAGRSKATDEHARAVLGDDAFARASQGGMGGGDTLLFALSAKGRAAGERFASAAGEFCVHVHDLLYFDGSKRSKGYDRVDLWINDDIRVSSVFQNLVALGHVMYEASEKLVSACQELVGFMEDVDGAAIIQRDIASTAMALKDLLASAELILFDGSATFAYAAHLIKRGQGGENLQALMLNVGSAMNEMLYARAHSIVFTSATMTIAQSFESFNSSMGLGESEHSAVRTCYLESSYDFDANMVVYIAEDMPEPNAPGYLEALEKLLIGVHRAQQGSTLTLFTNRREMEKSYQTVQRAVKQDDLRIVCQKWGVSVKGLRDDFLSDEHLSLFALKSFWEGFDAPGATLKTVVIPKLPFGKPTDPLSCERGQVDPQAWSHYVLPAAVLETKQAAGRLIRTSTDRGALVLADKRLITKGYGKVFLNSLPSRNIQVLSSSEIFEVLSRESERR
jgi:ATP-dependent DNA helicase DinG